jgi:hypothetical protein
VTGGEAGAVEIWEGGGLRDATVTSILFIFVLSIQMEHGPPVVFCFAEANGHFFGLPPGEKPFCTSFLK